MFPLIGPIIPSILEENKEEYAAYIFQQKILPFPSCSLQSNNFTNIQRKIIVMPGRISILNKHFSEVIVVDFYFQGRDQICLLPHGI
jgi:hypothetical protein